MPGVQQVEAAAGGHDLAAARPDAGHLLPARIAGTGAARDGGRLVGTRGRAGRDQQAGRGAGAAPGHELRQILLAWLKLLALDGDLAKAEPKTLRYRVLHSAARLVRGGRKRRLKIQADLAMG